MGVSDPGTTVTYRKKWKDYLAMISTIATLNESIKRCEIEADDILNEIRDALEAGVISEVDEEVPVSVHPVPGALTRRSRQFLRLLEAGRPPLPPEESGPPEQPPPTGSP